MTQLPHGFYKVTAQATLRFLRNSQGQYHEIDTLSLGDLVYVTAQTPQLGARSTGESYFDGNAKAGTAEGEFKLGGWRTHHSWSIALSTMTYDGDVKEGWVDNGKLTPVRNEVERVFRDGDVLYGRWEAREPWIQEKIEVDKDSFIRTYRFNIIDRLNKKIINNELLPIEIDAFATFLEKYTGTERRNVPQITIRKLCKCGLTYITNTCGNRVHFMLDGLDADRVMREAGVQTQLGVQDHSEGPTKYCTGAEMRRIMRQKMHDMGKQYGKNYAIDLGKVLFYLASERVPAPWENGAPGRWGSAWASYSVYRQGKS